MKNKSVALAKKTNAIGMKLKEDCPPITYNVLQLAVSAGLWKRNYQHKNKLQWKNKI